MNLLINYFCPKKCSFCFLPYTGKEEMPFEMLKRYVGHYKEKFFNNCQIDRIGILGGEPTFHSKFDKIIGHISSLKAKNIYLFTNLWNIENCYSILRFFLKQKGIIIWNNSEYDRLPTTIRKTILSFIPLLTEIAAPYQIFMSLTITMNTTIAKLAYLTQLRERFGINHIRIAVDIAQQTRLIGTTLYEDILIYLLNLGFVLSQDNCGYPLRCYFKKNDYSYYRDKIDNLVLKCKPCSGIDVLPDGNCIPCLPASNRFLKVPFFQLSKYNYNVYFQMVKSNIKQNESCYYCGLDCEGTCPMVGI